MGQPNGTAIQMMSHDLTGQLGCILNFNSDFALGVTQDKFIKKTNLLLGYRVQVGGQPNSALGRQAASTQCPAIPKLSPVKKKHLPT